MTTRRLALLTISLLTLAFAGSARAEPGDLIGQTCISKTGTSGCALLAQPNMLESANGVAVSPDGADVYVGAGAGVAHFRRVAGGALTYADCVDVSSGGDRCPTASAPPDAGGALSTNSIHLAISPDGKHLYVTSWLDALLWWTRDPATGGLTWGGCRDAASDSATNGRCGTATTLAGGNFPADSMAFTQGIAVTPDGQTIYIADQQEGLLQAQRNASTGAATPTACFNTSGSEATGCTATAAGIPMALSSIDLASNSRDIYVRSISPGGITHFSRSAGGATSFTSCVGAPPCTTAAPSPVFAFSGSLAVAGDLVITHGGNYGPPSSGTIVRLARNPNGSLGYESCATTEASPGPCAVLPVDTVAGSIGRLLVSPDASSVYLPQVGNTESALTRLTGSLAFRSCLSDTGIAACSSPPLPTPFGVSPGQMSLSPDGRNIYQAAHNTLNIFDVEQAATGGVSDPAANPGAPPATPAATRPRIRSVKRLKKGRYRVKVQIFQAGKITARFTGKLRKKAKAKTLGKVAGKLATKATTYPIIVKPSSAARKRRIRAKLIVSIASAGYLPAEATKTVRLR